MRKDLRPEHTVLSDDELDRLPIYVARHVRWLYRQTGLKKGSRSGRLALIARIVAGLFKGE